MRIILYGSALTRPCLAARNHAAGLQ